MAQAGGRRAPGVRVGSRMPRHRLPAAFRPRWPGAGMHVHDGDASWIRCPACRAGPSLAVARVSAERARRTARLAVRIPACAHIRPHAANGCRNAVYTVILHCLGTPMPFEGRGGAAGPGRLANGTVTSAEPGAKRRSGRRRWRPRPTGATVRSGRRWCRREPWRLSGPACYARPPRLSADGGAAAGLQGPRARSVLAPVARSSGERTVRQHAALPGRMLRVLA